MSRFVIGMLVAATAGALSWWANHRGSASRQATALAAPELTNQPTPAATVTGEDKITVVPRGDIDPKMVITPPDVDPKMVITPPDVDPKMVITPPWPPKSQGDSGGSAD